MKKRLLALVMAGALTLGLLAGCGNDGGGKTGGETSPSPSASTPASPGASTPAEPSAPVEPSSAASGTFKIGGVGPLTGDAAIYGQAAMNGAQIAVDEINALGGAVQFEFKPEDDVADGETSVNAYNNLMDWGMQALVGPVTTGAAISVSAKLYEERVFGLTPSASSTDVISGKDNVYQVCFTDPNQGVGAADYMAENFADAKIAVIYRNDDAYSQGIRDAFVKEAGDKGLSIVYQGTFTLDTSSNFSVQLAAAQTAGADLVFLPIYYQPASVIFAQAKAMGYAPTFFGVDGMDGILDMPGFDTTLAEGLVLMTPFCATVESSKSFVDAYTAAYGTTPNQFAADAYDGVYIVKAALEAAGCTADMSNEEICDALVSAMTSLKFTGLTGTDMSWNAEGQVSKAPTAYVVKDGQYVEG